MEDLKITDILNVDILQRLQDSFVAMTQTACLIVDTEGNNVTRPSKITEFCEKYVKLSEASCQKCGTCYVNAIKAAKEKGATQGFICHAGLIAYGNPIVMEGVVIGGIIVGQVKLAALSEASKKAVQELVKELDVDFDAYWEAFQKIDEKSEEELQRSADFAYTMAGIASELAYSRYRIRDTVKEIEAAANMKSDFLANMSHEIRTPMNAVIGMAEMALREDLSDSARDYIVQIKNSGRSLLNIINDILDFSKIESSKMDIIPEDYDPLSLFNDVANIVITRLIDKNVELILHFNPKLPRKLLGDSQRIRQVLINLSNNAIKFTNKGRVFIDVDFEPLGDKYINLKVSVKDTGIGIKEDDLNKLFQSFQQVDSKRNRNIEGTGLGLAICKRLVNLMDGDIGVTSKYEAGSTFYFNVPQEILEPEAALTVKEAEDIFVVGYFRNKYIARQFYRDCKELSVMAAALTDYKHFDLLVKQYGDYFSDRKVYLFVEEELYDDNIRYILDRYPKIHCVLLTEFGSRVNPERSKMIIVHKPYSTVVTSMVLNNESSKMRSLDSEAADFDFIAPEAEVLIVDDNSINLTVAEGLLEPLKMKIVTAISGKMAIDEISRRHYDLIFMDHMMPEIDGVETTRIIRRMYPNYENVPIIALTANAVEGAKEMFLSEGMNDMVAKPIEVRTIVSKVKQWLSPEKILKAEEDAFANTQVNDTSMTSLEIPGLNVADAVAMLGSEKLYLKILKDYYQAIDKKAESILSLEQRGEIGNYTVEVHALKSLSKQIGAIELSKMAEELEKAGNNKDIPYIRNNTGKMLKRYMKYKELLAPYFTEEENKEEKETITSDALIALLDELLEACDNLDMDEMENLNEKLLKNAYPEEQEAVLSELSEAVSNIDVDTIAELVNQWKAIL